MKMDSPLCMKGRLLLIFLIECEWSKGKHSLICGGLKNTQGIILKFCPPFCLCRGGVFWWSCVRYCSERGLMIIYSRGC